MEFGLRRFSSAPAAPTMQTRKPVHHAVHQPAQSADQPPQYSARQPVQPSSQSRDDLRRRIAASPPSH